MTDEIIPTENGDEEKENIEEIIEEVQEEITKDPEENKTEPVKKEGAPEVKKPETPVTTNPPETIKKSKLKDGLINYILIGILVIAVVALAVLDYPKISKYVKGQGNKYGFDYNFSKVRGFDWDTMITEKKVANALKVPLQKINSAKNPDYSWVLEEPQQFVDEIKCAALIDEKILNEADENGKNLFNINVTVCINKKETGTMFDQRKDETQNISKTDSTVAIKSFEDTKNIGEKGYTYIIEKTGTNNPLNPNDTGTSTEKYGGISFVRGPFIVMIDESEQKGMAVLSNKESQAKLAEFIDKELKKILTWY